MVIDYSRFIFLTFDFSPIFVKTLSDCRHPDLMSQPRWVSHQPNSPWHGRIRLEMPRWKIMSTKKIIKEVGSRSSLFYLAWHWLCAPWQCSNLLLLLQKLPHRNICISVKKLPNISCHLDFLNGQSWQQFLPCLLLNCVARSLLEYGWGCPFLLFYRFALLVTWLQSFRFCSFWGTNNSSTYVYSLAFFLGDSCRGEWLKAHRVFIKFTNEHRVTNTFVVIVLTNTLPSPLLLP